MLKEKSAKRTPLLRARSAPPPRKQAKRTFSKRGAARADVSGEPRFHADAKSTQMWSENDEEEGEEKQEFANRSRNSIRRSSDWWRNIKFLNSLRREKLNKLNDTTTMLTFSNVKEKVSLSAEKKKKRSEIHWNIKQNKI